ncbi:phospholipid carrier-dependent glycosyltransferase [bacterium]|nr:phospholipid carrier-dependent glycosyltransferase [bacterium]
MPSKILAARVFMTLFFLALLAPRVLFLSADPSSSFSLGFISDEGWWSHNARQAALFGKWIMDDFNQGLVISPVFSLLSYVAFKVLGVSFFAARLPSALAGFGCVVLVFFWIRQNQRHREAVLRSYLAAFLLGTDFFFLSFNRVALVDTIMVFLMVLGFFLWDRESVVSAFLSGLVLFAALLAKPFAFMLYPVLLLVWVWEWQTGNLKSRRIVVFLVSSCLAALIWLLCMLPGLLPQFLELNLRFSSDNLATTPGKILVGLKTFFFRTGHGKLYASRFFNQASVLCIFTFWSMLMFCYRFRGNGLWKLLSGLSRWQVINGLWIIIGLLFFIPNPYKPEHRFLFLFPPMVMFTAEVLTRWFIEKPGTALSQLFERHGRSIFQALLLWALPLPIVLQAIPYLSNLIDTRGGSTGKPDLVMIMLLFFLIYMVCIVTGVFLVHILKNHRLNFKFIAFLVLLFFSVIQVYYWVDLWSNLSWTMYTTSKRLGDSFGQDTVVMGPVSDTFSLENNAFSIVQFNVNERVTYNSRALETFQPDYYLTIHSIEGEIFPDMYLPHFRDRLHFIERIPVLPDRQAKPRVLLELYSFASERSW